MISPRNTSVTINLELGDAYMYLVSIAAYYSIKYIFVIKILVDKGCHDVRMTGRKPDWLVKHNTYLHELLVQVRVSVFFPVQLLLSADAMGFWHSLVLS